MRGCGCSAGDNSALGTRSYDPYGVPTLETGTWNDFHGRPRATLGWAGEYKDIDTGFVYLRARHYDPVTAQFLQTDPLTGGSCNTHDYVCANPLGAVDPTGHCLWDLCAGEAYAVAAGVVAVAGATVATYKWLQKHPLHMPSFDWLTENSRPWDEVLDDFATECVSEGCETTSTYCATLSTSMRWSIKRRLWQQVPTRG